MIFHHQERLPIYGFGQRVLGGIFNSFDRDGPINYSQLAMQKVEPRKKEYIYQMQAPFSLIIFTRNSNL